MGNDPAAGDPEEGPGLVQGIETNTEGVIDMLAGVVVLPTHEAAAATFRTMAKRVGRDTAVNKLNPSQRGDRTWITPRR